MTQLPAVLATFLLSCAANLGNAEVSFGNYCTTETPCRAGNRVEDKGFANQPWKPFETDSPFVWAADACLGYFMTRNPAAWNGGQTELVDSHHTYVVLGDLADVPNWRARVHIFNWPFNEYGVFQCENTRWPMLEFNDDEFQRWVGTRMTGENGWTPSNRFGDFMQFRNEKFGALVRVYEIGGEYNFRIEADYFGPPIVFD